MDTETREPLVVSPPGSFEGFYRQWFPPVARAVSLVVRDVDFGQEMAQEAFARLWGRWDEIGSDDHARNFVFQVSLNLARSYLRRRPFRLGRTDTWSHVGSSDSATRVTDRIAVFRALASLTVRQRECVVLVDYLGYDAASAGALLEIRPATVRVQLMRGRAKLRERLGEEP
jgi:RNA polymerase sigma-70 factor, ECF subfamily